MPIYEYQCKKCEHCFESLELTRNEPPPACPKCRSEEVEKLMSASCIRANGIPAGSGGYQAPSCSPSGGG